MEKIERFWSEFNLPGLQSDLDAEAEQIGTRRAASETSRKALVEATRDFRKEASEDVRKRVAPLMKLFQAEVDTLNKRAKAAETTFLSLYKKLVVAPDPAAALASALADQSHLAASKDMEIENQKLRQTIEEYHQEFAEMKNQEVTIKRLKEELAELKDDVDQTVQSRLRDRERQLNREFAEKQRELQEERLKVAEKLGEAEHASSTLRAALETTQAELFDVKSKYEEENQARSQELDMVSSDLDRANQRIDTLEKEMERMRMDEAQRSAPASSDSAADDLAVSTLERELASKEREIAMLVDDLHNLQAKHADMKESYEQRLTTMEAVVHSKKEDTKALEAKLAKQADYDEVRKELEVLKSVQFGEDAKSDSLEHLLSAKCRNLETENTRLKTQLSEATLQVQDLQAKEKQLSVVNERQTTLISQLEGHLSSLKLGNAGDAPGSSETTGTKSIPRVTNEEAMTGQVPETQNSGTTDTVLPIVASQRDRFRERNLELESENRHLQQNVSSLRGEIDSVRADNIKLYEKIKFLQGYQHKVNMSDSDDTVNRYSSEYEEHINPFKAFNKQEKQRRYASLSPIEKITLNMGHMVLGNKMARMFFFVYALMLHALIFLVLYKYSHTESCKRNLAEQCMAHYAHHMHDVHHQNIGSEVFDPH